MTLMQEHEPIVQRYRQFFALFHWNVVHEPARDPSRPGKRPHPQTAYIKALLIKLVEGYDCCTALRRFLLKHPLLVLEVGFRPVLNRQLPYGFDVAKTVPTARWLRQQQRTLSQPVLQALLAATVGDLKECLFSTVPTWFSLEPGVVSTHATLQYRTPQRSGILLAVHSHELLGHHWSCEKRLGAFPLKAGKTANRLMASRSTFIVAVVPSADKTLHSADTDQRRL